MNLTSKKSLLVLTVTVILSVIVGKLNAETVVGQYIDVRRSTTNDLSTSEQIISWLSAFDGVDTNPQKGQRYYYWARMITAYRVVSPEIDYLDIKASVSLDAPKQAVDTTMAQNIPIRLQVHAENEGISELANLNVIFRVTLYDQENLGLSNPEEIMVWSTDVVALNYGVSKTIEYTFTEPILGYDPDNTTELYATLEILNDSGQPTSAQPEDTPVLTVSLLSNPQSGPVINANPNEETEQVDLTWQAPGTDNTLFSSNPSDARLSQTIYVDHAGTASDPNGDSWQTAYYFLQDALLEAEYGDEVYVAAPTLNNKYYPDVSWADPAGSDDRTDTFNIPNGVKVYGGFPTHGGDMSQRDPDVYTTTLSGDIKVPEDINDNSYHVVTITDCDKNTLLDGFVIESGYANMSDPNNKGAGVYIENSDAVIKDCTIVSNAAVMASGIYCKQGSPVIVDCLIRNNYAAIWGGAGLYNETSSTTVVNSRFMLNFSDVDPNGLGGNGSAVYNQSSSPAITNCEFKCNTAKKNGGGIYNWDSEPEFINCTFAGNIADGIGGGMYNDPHYPGQVMIKNSILWGNTDSNPTFDEDSQIAGYLPVVYSSCIQDEIPDDGNLPFNVTANNNIDSNPLFVTNPNPGPDSQWNTADDCIGDTKLTFASPCIEIGDNSYLPEDSLDINEDGKIYELIPLDAAGHNRIVDRDNNLIATVDLGAFERGICSANPDLDNSTKVDFIDFAMFAEKWQQTGCDCYGSCCDGTDLNGDETVDIYDLQLFAQAWLTNPEPADNPQIKYWAENGHYYECVPNDITWQQAKIAAESKIYKGIRGHLATITTEEENDFIMNNIVGNHGGYWLGGFQPDGTLPVDEPDKNWQWVTGETWGPWANWYNGEPNDDQGQEDWVYVYASGHPQPSTFGYWNDAKDYSKAHYIVEYE